jgi:hypothetical protein
MRQDLQNKKTPNKAVQSTPTALGFSVDAASAAPEELARLFLTHLCGGSE